MPKIDSCVMGCSCKCHRVTKPKKQITNEKWIQHVKAYKEQHNCTYKEALQEAKKTYKQ